MPLIKYTAVKDIPKLFFIDTCLVRYKTNKKDKWYLEQALGTNVRFDFSTDSVSYSTKSGSFWMPKFTRALRTQEDCLQVIAARVAKNCIFEKIMYS